MERPFKEIYIRLKWLNHFAMCNVMAVEYVLKEFNSSVFMANPEFNILIKNFEDILANTQLKRNEDIELSFLDDLCRDIVNFYATMFTNDDKKKARKILDQHDSISSETYTHFSFYLGGCIFMSLLLIINQIFNSIERYAFHIE